jgi:alpha-D-ribose 1-methylphosphonate 5-triphosphate diphosphatase
MGAPNVMLGRSHSNNLSAIEAISHGVVDILCSDYYPPAMMHAVFKLVGLGHDMSYAVKLVSHNPAKALGVDHFTGSLEVGKDADVLIVSEHSGQPVIEQVFVSGLQVFQIQYHVPLFACEVLT